MSALDRVREKFKVPKSGGGKTSKRPSAASAASSNTNLYTPVIPSAGSAGAVPTRIDSIEVDGGVSLSPAQRAAREQVLAQLRANPSVQRAFCNRFEDGALIVTLAIRGVGTGELLISADRFNHETLDDFATLLDCMKGEGN